MRVSQRQVMLFLFFLLSQCTMRMRSVGTLETLIQVDYKLSSRHFLLFSVMKCGQPVACWGPRDPRQKIQKSDLSFGPARRQQDTS